jgi:hypothetical protein
MTCRIKAIFIIVPAVIPILYEDEHNPVPESLAAKGS